MDWTVGRGAARGLLSCLTDEQLRILDADDDYAAMLGYSRDALLGQSILSLTHPDDREIVRQQSQALVQGGAPFSITKRYITGDGRSFWATSHISLFQAGVTRRMMATVEPLEAAPVEDDRPSLRRAAERILAKRRLRHQFFDEDLFGEPAFDLLLDLYAQNLAGRATYTTSAAVASGAPLTTALRQIATLVDRGLVSRESDPIDRRRVMLCMTEDGARRMREYLLAAEQM